MVVTSSTLRASLGSRGRCAFELAISTVKKMFLPSMSENFHEVLLQFLQIPIMSHT